MTGRKLCRSDGSAQRGLSPSRGRPALRVVLLLPPLIASRPLAALAAIPGLGDGGAGAGLSGLGSFPTAALLAGGAVALLLGLRVAWSWRRLGRRLAAAETEAARNRAALSTMGEYWLWPVERDRSRRAGDDSASADTGGGTAGPALASVLGCDGADDSLAEFGAVLDRLDPAGRADLCELIRRLRLDGTAFRTRVADAGGQRQFEIIGQRGIAAEGDGNVDALWFRDVSDMVETQNRLQVRIAELTTQNTDFRHLFDRLQVPVWVRGPDLGILYCNAAYARAVDAGMPAKAVAKGAELAGGPLGWGRALADEAVRAGSAVTRTAYLVVGRSRRLLDVTELPIGGPESHWRVAGFAIDRTDADEARRELARHIESHAEVLESLGTGIVVYDADTRLQFFNTAFARMWDFETDWLRTAPDHGAILEDLRARRMIPDQVDFREFKQQLMELYTSLLEAHEELLHLPDERVIRTVTNPHPLGGLLITFEDVTDRLALERSYNTLIAVQSETLDHLHEGVAVFGSDARLKLFNPAFARIWRLDFAMLETEPRAIDVVESIRPLLGHDHDWETYRDRVVGAVLDRMPRSGRIERVDGSILDFEAVPLPDGAKLFSYIDVTDSMAVENALLERNEALVASDRLKSEFITNVSYELRTPLNTIIGFTEILSNQYFGSLNKRQAEYTRGILEASNALLSLIDDILDLAVIEAGRLRLELDEVNVSDMLDLVRGLAREPARKRGIALEFDCPDDIGTLRCDERRIKQALFNLISNGVAFTRKGGRIRVRVRRNESDVVFAVTDNGVGIDVPDQRRVMDPFERGKAGRSRGTGLGLGLALVRSFIEHHGGLLAIDSASGEGTTVRFSIPVNGPPPALDEEMPQA